MKNKKISYFSNAIEFLAVEINNQDIEEFYQSCIDVLATQERLEKPSLKDLFRGKDKTDKTYGNYLDKLIVLLNKYKVEIDSRNADLEFHKRPVINKHVGGGSGNATYYSIAFEEKIGEVPVALREKKPPEITLNSDITYRAKSLKRTPWYLKIAGKFFTKTRHRQFFVCLVFVYFIVAPIALGFLYALLPLLVWVLLFCCYCVIP